MRRQAVYACCIAVSIGSIQPARADAPPPFFGSRLSDTYTGSYHYRAELTALQTRRRTDFTKPEIQRKLEAAAQEIQAYRDEMTGSLGYQSLSLIRDYGSIASSAMGVGLQAAVAGKLLTDLAPNWILEGQEIGAHEYTIAVLARLEADGTLDSMSTLTTEERFDLLSAQGDFKALLAEDKSLPGLFRDYLSRTDWNRLSQEAKKAAKTPEKAKALRAKSAKVIEDGVKAAAAVPADSVDKLMPVTAASRADRQRQAFSNAYQDFEYANAFALGLHNLAMAANNPAAAHTFESVARITTFGMAVSALGAATTPTPAMWLNFLNGASGLLGIGGGGASSEEAMIRLQLQILEQLRQLEAKIDRYHMEEMARLYDIDVTTLTSGAVTDYIASADAQACEVVDARVSKALFSPLRIAKTTLLQASIDRCLSGLQDVFSGAAAPHPAYWLTPSRLAYGVEDPRADVVSGGTKRSYELTDTDKIDDFIKSYHNPLWTRFGSILSVSAKASFSSASPNIQTLRAKIAAIRSTAEEPSERAADRARYMGFLVDPVSLVRYATHALNLHELFASGSVGLRVDSSSTSGWIVRSSPPTHDDTPSTGLLQAALDQVDLAIGQQAYLAGDLLLEPIDHAVLRDWQWFYSDGPAGAGRLENDAARKYVSKLVERSSLVGRVKCLILRCETDGTSETFATWQKTTYEQSVAALAANGTLRRNFGLYWAAKKYIGRYGDNSANAYRLAHDLACKTKNLVSLRNTIGDGPVLVHWEELGRDESYWGAPYDRSSLGACIFLVLPKNESTQASNRLTPSQLDSSDVVLVPLPGSEQLAAGDFEMAGYIDPLYRIRRDLISELARISLPRSKHIDRALTQVALALGE